MIATALRYAPLLIVAVLWEVVARSGLVSSAALPPLSTVAASWFELLRDGDLTQNGLASIYRGAAGLALAVVIGSVLGFLMAGSRAAERIVNPLIELFYPLPKSALIPVTALWLGFGDSSKILLIALGCMLPITVGAYNGARSVEPTLLWSARSLGAGRLRLLRDVTVPTALPELFSGIRTAMALAFVLLVSSELVVSRDGFGYLIGFLGSNGAYAPMFAAVLTVAFLGFVADRAFQAGVRRAFAWRD